MAGQALSSLPLVDIEVQVSPTGEPGRANASWLATVGSVEPSESARVEVILEQLSPDQGSAPPKSGTADAGVGVEVQVALPEGGEAEGAVFVLARPSGSAQRMPTAVVRREASQLPFRVRLDDAASMAGQTLSSLPRVDIEVQVSPTGQPGRANASWVATVSSVEPSDSAVIEVVLEQNSP